MCTSLRITRPHYVGSDIVAETWRNIDLLAHLNEACPRVSGWHEQFAGNYSLFGRAR